jgi:hypothetical protein
MQVEKFVSGLNINMDNLCQYLSQERVQEFTKMNAKELLINTEKTVGKCSSDLMLFTGASVMWLCWIGTSEMYANHQKLIELCKSGGGQEKNLDNAQQSLQSEKQRLETWDLSLYYFGVFLLVKYRLKKKMESMKERLALVKEIREVQSKIPWVEYNEKVDRAEEVCWKITIWLQQC